MPVQSLFQTTAQFFDGIRSRIHGAQGHGTNDLSGGVCTDLTPPTFR